MNAGSAVVKCYLDLCNIWAKLDCSCWKKIKYYQSYLQIRKETFTEKGQDFDVHALTFPFSRMIINDFELYGNIEFKSSELWNTKFAELMREPGQFTRNTIVGSVCQINKCICLRKVAFAMLSALGLSTTCKQILPICQSF